MSSFEPLVANPGRLRILTALAGESSSRRKPFVELRRQTGLTDGNLATHARRLQSAGFIAIEKSIESGKPLTTLQLTTRGRDALAAHAHELLRLLQPTTTTSTAAVVKEEAVHDQSADDDDWVD